MRKPGDPIPLEPCLFPPALPRVTSVNPVLHFVWCKEIQPVHSKGDQSWVFFGRSDAEAETPVLWPPYTKSWLIAKDWCWEGWGAGGEGDDRGWDGWMASLTWSMWVWVNSRSWWWTGRPGVLQFMGLQNWTDWIYLRGFPGGSEDKASACNA